MANSRPIASFFNFLALAVFPGNFDDGSTLDQDHKKVKFHRTALGRGEKNEVKRLIGLPGRLREKERDHSSPKSEMTE